MNQGSSSNRRQNFVQRFKRGTKQPQITRISGARKVNSTNDEGGSSLSILMRNWELSDAKKKVDVEALPASNGVGAILPVRQPATTALPIIRGVSDPGLEVHISDSQVPVLNYMPPTARRDENSKENLSDVPWLQHGAFKKIPKKLHLESIERDDDERVNIEQRYLFYQVFSYAEDMYHGDRYIQDVFPKISDQEVLSFYASWISEGRPDFRFSEDEDKLLITAMALVDVTEPVEDVYKKVQLDLAELKEARFSGKVRSFGPVEKFASSRRSLLALHERLRCLSHNFAVVRRIYGYDSLPGDGIVPRFPSADPKLKEVLPQHFNKAVEIFSYHGSNRTKFAEQVERHFGTAPKTKAAILANINVLEKHMPVKFTMFEYCLLVDEQRHNQNDWDKIQKIFVARDEIGLKRRFHEIMRAYRLLKYLDMLVKTDFVQWTRWLGTPDYRIPGKFE